MNISSIIKGILNLQKEIEVAKLPSQGLFYKSDFKIFIKKADIEDIIEYEYQYEKENLGLVINRVKRIVKKNISTSSGYTFNDIKSVDVVFIFLEIVKFTNNKSIDINYFNDILGKNDIVKFDYDNFNYAMIDTEMMKNYDTSSKEFVIDGFRYSVPCIGIENSITNFLISRSDSPNAKIYNGYSYDFLYFLGHKSILTFDEIENILQIFNNDMSVDDQKKITNIVNSFSNFGKYTLKTESRIIEITSKIDLEKIWK